MQEGLTVVQTARVVGGLHWTTARLFEIFGSWAAEVDRPDVAVALATASRHMGWHNGDLEQLLPDAELLSDEAVSRPHDPAVGVALDAIGRITGSVERLAVAQRVLLARVAARCIAIVREAAPHSDAPLARVAGYLLDDLRRDRDDGESLLSRIIVDVATVERVSGRVLEAESRLVAAGGLLPNGFD